MHQIQTNNEFVTVYYSVKLSKKLHSELMIHRTEAKKA